MKTNNFTNANPDKSITYILRSKKRLFALQLIVLLFSIIFFPVLIYGQEYGEDLYLYQDVDDLENHDNWGYNQSITHNATLDALHLRFASGGGLQNFSTYTEVDANNDFTVNDYDISFDTFRRDADSHIYYDFGAGSIGDFEMDLVFNVTDIEAGDGTGADYLAILDLSNVVGSIASAQSPDDTLHIRQRQEGANDDLFRWNFIQRTGGVTDFNYIQPLGTNNPLGDYWCTLIRNSTGIYFWAWNDEARTSLNWFQSETVNHASTTYQYVYAICGINSAGDGADHSTGSAHNLTLTLPPAYDNSGYIFSVNRLNGIGASLFEQFNATIPTGDSITVQWSSDNSTWVDSEGVAGSETLENGTSGFDLRDLNYTNFYELVNFTDGGADSTPMLLQDRLIYFNGTAPAGAGGVSPIGMIGFFVGVLICVPMAIVLLRGRK